MSEWAEGFLGDVAENLDYLRRPVKESERLPGPYPYYGASGVVDHVDGYTCDGEYLLVAEDGENLRTIKTPIAFLAKGRFWVNNHAHILQGVAGVSDTRFLMHAVRYVGVEGFLTGSTMPKLTQGNLNHVRVPLPPLDEQRAIAALLGALDDKIELNRRMNHTLEEMGSALFERVVGDAGEEDDLEVHAQALIDRGALTIGDGYRAKREELAVAGIPFARAGNIDAGFLFADAELLGWDAVSRAGSKVSEPFDIVFTSKGTVGRFAFVAPSTPQFAYSPQLCFWRSLDHDELSPFFLYHWMRSRRFLEQVDAVKGQTDMADYVSLTDQRLMRVACPPPSFHRRLRDEVSTLWDLHFANTDESKTLALLRDALLPKLLSGEVRLKQAEIAVEAAL